MKIASILLGCLGLALTAAILELGKNTLGGWITAGVVFVLLFVALFRVPAGRAGLYWACLGLCVLGVGLAIFFSRPPVKAIPAVSVKNPEKTGVVTVEQGQLTGVVNGEGTVEVFAGVPYAKPPVGDLRWREPEAPEAWEGVRACDTFAPMSMQSRGSTLFNSMTDIVVFRNYRITLEDNFQEPMSEDSLYLNIWRPKGAKAGESLPVLVYIHGGSLTGGQPSNEQYNGERMAEQGILVVNLGYRLNVFGYFAHEDLAAESPNGTTGNYGLLDQIAALRWVHENIAAFGGDPEKVTIAGESAGASSVNALCVSPLTEGLFRYAIAESSGIVAKHPYHTFRDYDDALEMGQKVMAEMGAADIAALRALPAEKLVQTRYQNSSMTVDGYAVTEQPWLTYERGANHEEALLNGFNGHEADFFTLPHKVTAENYVELAANVLGDYAAEGTALYPAKPVDEGYHVVIDAGGNAKGSAFKFPHTVYNAAGGYLSILSGIKGYGVTITTGPNSGLDSIGYSMNVIHDGQEEAMMATGTDENIPIITELGQKLGVAASEPVAPYSGSEGFVVGDGSVSVILETEDYARARGAKVYCYAIGYGNGRKNVKFGKVAGSGEALDNAISSALNDAGVSIDEIDAVCGFANGLKVVDDIEKESYARVFGDKLKGLPLFQVKERVGEGRAASATLAASEAALMLSGELPQNDAYFVDGAAVTKKSVPTGGFKKILVTAFATGGSYSAVVLGK